jgi:hypothetical protein
LSFVFLVINNIVSSFDLLNGFLKNRGKGTAIIRYRVRISVVFERKYR